MYAIVEIAGQQFKVEKDQQIFVHRLDAKTGSKVSFDKVLLTDDNGKVNIGKPTLSGVSVSAKVLEHLKGDKVVVFKKKRRKGYRVKNGHRQYLTKIEIDKIGKSVAKKTVKQEESDVKKTVAKKKSAKTKTKASTTKKSTAKKTTKKETKPKTEPKPKPKKGGGMFGAKKVKKKYDGEEGGKVDWFLKDALDTVYDPHGTGKVLKPATILARSSEGNVRVRDVVRVYSSEGEEGISELAWTSPFTRYIIEAFDEC